MGEVGNVTGRKADMLNEWTDRPSGIGFYWVHGTATNGLWWHTIVEVVGSKDKDWVYLFGGEPIRPLEEVVGLGLKWLRIEDPGVPRNVTGRRDGV